MQTQIYCQTLSNAIHSYLISSHLCLFILRHFRLMPRLRNFPSTGIRRCCLFTSFLLLLFLLLFLYSNPSFFSPYWAPLQLNQEHRHGSNAHQGDECKAPSSAHVLDHDVDYTRPTGTDEATYEVVGCCGSRGRLWV